MKLSGLNILVTGANGGLGTAVTEAMLDEGASVVGVSRSISAAEFPRERFTAISAEITSGEQAAALVEKARAKTGRLDGLVHLIGGFAGGKTVADTDDATFQRMLEMNLLSSFYLIRAALSPMRAQGAGRILAIGSKSAVQASPNAGAYGASKAALVSLIRTVARENMDRGITANIVLPGTMDTAGNRAGSPGADYSKWVDPRQVAQLLVHLLSADASQINGAQIPVYGTEA